MCKIDGGGQTPSKPLTYFISIIVYNHAHRLRLEKILNPDLSRSPNEFFKPLLDPSCGVAVSLLKPPSGGFKIEMAVSEVERPKI
jgi:hypothetical protein